MVVIKVKKPKAVLFDISGTVARESFVEKILIPYFKIAHRVYMENTWQKPECQECIKQLAEMAQKDVNAPKINLACCDDKKTMIDQVCQCIDYCLVNNKEGKAFANFRFKVWFDGYERQKLTTPVYSDVAVTIQRWKCNQNVKLYVLSNGWTEASKRFMSKTSHGDLNLVIDDHFDTSMGSLLDPQTFQKVAQIIRQRPEDVIFLTKSPEEAIAARKAGLNVVLVLTHGAAVDAALELVQDIPIVRTFTEIEFI
ncbi:Enolase-phosphatase E1 [Sarcoptes scabiei]|uniref:Enolase-phosphatase E-1-like protein 3 n=1 Tax=Sarcoptes scabiei TaxID=52283 RepID=A0A132ADC3_SARSC|nr:Enolase-phosphatase E1 [Sarcoptes scabiei]KPM08986.1 enolase-phosphatase E-1-like protein 3 [Sarcoptes scabiei]UXI22661.1 hypothetical protein NH340_JMT08604 [Sarcoptes scabiei]